MKRIAVIMVFMIVVGVSLTAQDAEPGKEAKKVEALEAQVRALQTRLESLAKSNDDVLWLLRMGDIADVDKVIYTGPPNPKAEEIYGIKNERHPMVIFAYVFVPKKLDRAKKHPLLVLLHGGVHSDFTSRSTHVVRELMEEGYVVIAPEYRGSTGYGEDYFRAIDYGGLEVEDCVAGRDWAVENLPFVDAQRTGIMGWSHGGLIALMAVFNHPDKFVAAYAGVPVSDLLARMGFTTDRYRAEFSAPYHLGKTANQDVDLYRRRSPVWNVDKLKTPLLVHTNTNDRDVNVVEVEHLIQALKAAGKTFEYKIYNDAPGGHSFNRLDTPLARQSRREVYQFLARYLKPGK